MSIGRNDPCPCGSGLRFKKCCGKLEADHPTATLSSPPAAEDAATLLKRAITHHQAGNLVQAATIYRQILEKEPRHADALHLSGLIAGANGDFEQAIALISQAIECQPTTAAFHSNLGNVMQEHGDLQAACHCYEEAIRLKPDFAPAAFNLGNCLLKLNQPMRATEWYERALAIQPAFAEAAIGMGNALLETRRVSEAQSWFRRGLELHPESADALDGLGQAMRAQGSLEEACECFRRALAFDSRNLAAHLHLGETLLQQGRGAHAVAAFEAAVRELGSAPEAHYGLGNAYFDVGELQQAIASYKQALRLRPDFAEAHYNLGNVYRAQDRCRDAMLCYEQAVKCRPDFFAARWAECMAHIPVVYKDFEEIAVARAHYREGLEKLTRAMQLDSPSAIDAAVMAAQSMQPFYLAYQGQNDRELQISYGELMTKIMSVKYPQWSAPIVPSATPRARLRVGFVSAFFHSHSNWKLPIKGWLEQLDPGKFALYGYFTGKQALKDAQTDIARMRFERFVEDTDSLEELASAIRADELDVLIYPEIGMSPISASLAALRLAPVQCNSWGHPQTSGLPTIDYFLSSALMEPAGADAHYSEKLVRLPNLSVYCEATEHPPTTYARGSFGLAEDRPLFFCAQSLFKYLPQFDMVFPAIAERVGKCQFAFIDYPQSPELTQRFVDRIAQEFRSKGLQAEDYVLVLPHLQATDYLAVNQLADVFLDSLGWNGCNSTLEAINCNLPIVTMPGQLMRGMHSPAMLKMIGMEETIARDIDSYIDIASKLGNNAELRRTMSNKIAANKHRLARDRSAIDGLEKFLLQAAAR
ncbi:MAG: tetratricopeptide repeat protein [Burkholderiales bacterium]|nr:tetratricopeptide repeat protein [Burkholderiales bacterium]